MAQGLEAERSTENAECRVQVLPVSHTESLHQVLAFEFSLDIACSWGSIWNEQTALDNPRRQTTPSLPIPKQNSFQQYFSCRAIKMVPDFNVPFQFPTMNGISTLEWDGSRKLKHNPQFCLRPYTDLLSVVGFTFQECILINNKYTKDNKIVSSLQNSAAFLGKALK